MDDREREQELRALEFMRVGVTAALELVPAESVWFRPFREFRSVLDAQLGTEPPLP